MTIGSTITATTTAQGSNRAHHGHGGHGRGTAAVGTAADKTTTTKATASASATATATDPTAGKTLEQLAADGDPTAIAELKLEHPQAAAGGPTNGEAAAGPRAGAREPGKGEQFDAYA